MALKNGTDPKKARLTRSAATAERMVANRASRENSRRMISKPKNMPVSGALKVAAMPPAAPQATITRSFVSDIRTNWPMLDARADPIWTIGPSRPTEPPVPMHRAEPLDHGDRRTDPAPVLCHGQHDLGHAVPAGLAREPLDERPVEEPAEHGHEQDEPDAEPRQVQAGDPALLTELLVTRGQPREAVDQPPEPDGAEPPCHADGERHGHHPEARRPQPRRCRLGHPTLPGADHSHPADQLWSGTSPAASAKARRASTRSALRSGAIAATMRAISWRRRAVTSSTRARPVGVTPTRTLRRSVVVRWRRARCFRTRRSVMRVAVEGGDPE